MDTEEIAHEIVTIRNRLDEIGSQLEGAAGTDIDDERKQLEERLRFLKGRVSEEGTDNVVEQDKPARPETVHYLPPA